MQMMITNRGLDFVLNVFRVQPANVKVRAAWFTTSCSPRAGKTVVQVNSSAAAGIYSETIVSNAASARREQWQTFSTRIWLRENFF